MSVTRSTPPLARSDMSTLDVCKWRCIRQRTSEDASTAFGPPPWQGSHRQRIRRHLGRSFRIVDQTFNLLFQGQFSFVCNRVRGILRTN
jgi:hypothetical protein